MTEIQFESSNDPNPHPIIEIVTLSERHLDFFNDVVEKAVTGLSKMATGAEIAALLKAIENVSNEKELVSLMESKIYPLFLQFVRVIWLFLPQPFSGPDPNVNYLALFDIGIYFLSMILTFKVMVLCNSTTRN